MEELLNYEIESILLSRVRDVFPHHQKITAAAEEFWDNISSSVDNELAQKHGWMKKIESNTAVIAKTYSQIKLVQNESVTAALQQKVLEKQISNVMKQQEKIGEEIREGMSQGESYALEIVDLQQEVEESKMKKKCKWDGLKRACDAYKSVLQFGITVIDSLESCNKVRLTFFKSKKDKSLQYYVDLARSADLWYLDLIHPSLEPNHQEKLSHVVNFKNHREISDFTAFLCTVRKVFKELYEAEKDFPNSA